MNNSLSSKCTVEKTALSLTFPNFEDINYISEEINISIIDGINQKHEGDTIIKISAGEYYIFLSIGQIKAIDRAIYENLLNSVQV